MKFSCLALWAVIGINTCRADDLFTSLAAPSSKKKEKGCAGGFISQPQCSCKGAASEGPQDVSRCVKCTPKKCGCGENVESVTSDAGGTKCVCKCKPGKGGDDCCSEEAMTTEEPTTTTEEPTTTTEDRRRRERRRRTTTTTEEPTTTDDRRRRRTRRRATTTEKPKDDRRRRERRRRQRRRDPRRRATTTITTTESDAAFIPELIEKSNATGIYK